MLKKRAWLLLWLPACGLLGASCGSDPSSSPESASGAPTADAGEPGSAGAGTGASASQGGAGFGAGAASAAGGRLDAGGAPAAEGGSDAGGASQGGEPSQGGATDAGGSPGNGGAPPLVADAACLEHEDCLPVCNANGWPAAHCFGSSDRFCSCESESGGPTCTKGTTEGCPTGTACRSPQQCMPYGDGTQGDPCDNGDECAPGFICVGFGNPLPNGESTACSLMCDPLAAPPGCDCTAGYCLGGLGLFDLECAYPSGTPCSRTVAVNDTRVAKISGPGELTPGYVYVVSIASQGGQDVDLEVCGSPECQGDHVCASSDGGSSERCFLQAGDDELFVHLINRSNAPATIQLDVEADSMMQYELSFTQVTSSLGPSGHRRMLVTGLTPATTYELSVTTANGRDINLAVSNDLHGTDELCNEDLMGASASCDVTVTRASMWAVLTDTSGIGDAYTFKVTAQ